MQDTSLASLHQAPLKEFEDLCRRIGLKLTHQRLEIFRELAKAKDHPSAEALFKRVRGRVPTISLDTVYRTLSTLEDNGLVTRIQTALEQARFEPDTRPHHHMVCTACKTIVDFDWNALDGVELPAEIAAWGNVTGCHVVLTGTCRECAAQTS